MAYSRARDDSSVPDYLAWFPCRCTQPPPDDEAALYAAVAECACHRPTRLTFRRHAATVFAAAYTVEDRDGMQRHLSDEQQRAIVFLAALPDRRPVNQADGGEVAGDAQGADTQRFALLTGCMSSCFGLVGAFCSVVLPLRAQSIAFVLPTGHC